MEPAEKVALSNERTLTEADVRAIAAEVIRQGEPAVQHWFYSNLGRGLWGVIWKAIVVSLVGLAAYGAAGGHKPWA